MQSRNIIVERYIRATWMLKVRLISARRTLWGSEYSLIHIESAALQMRKICEALAYLCVLSADIEFDASHSSQADYRVGATLVRLAQQKRLLFPRRARLEAVEKIGSGTRWSLKIDDDTKDRRDRVRAIHNRCGSVLHEFQPNFPLPSLNEIERSTWALLNAVRADHQWLWNEFWQHANFLKDEVFFINLGDNSDANDRPTLFSVEGFLEQPLDLEFDSSFLADFSGTIDWNDYKDGPSAT